jgi:hypothetical protein
MYTLSPTTLKTLSSATALQNFYAVAYSAYNCLALSPAAFKKIIFKTEQKNSFK